MTTPQAEGHAPPLRRIAITTRPETEPPMSKSDKPVKALRYRSYFWLMDFSAILVALFVCILFADMIIDEDLTEAIPYIIFAAMSALFQIVTFLILPFLICTKFMRDDYSDTLWRRSVSVLAYASTTIPLTIFVITQIYFLGVGKLSKGPPLIRWVTNKITVDMAMISIWISYMILFVAIFQILRWRDAR